MAERDDFLSGLHREATRRASRESCPPLERLARAAMDDLERDERWPLVDHLGACPDCADEMRLAREVARAAREATARHAFLRRASSLALAASVVLAAGLALTRPPEGDDHVLRGARSSSATVIPADRALLDEAPRLLAWPPVAGALGCRVILYDAESSVLWESLTLKEPRSSLPPEVRARLIPGRIYYWRTVALFPVAREQSPLFAFRFAR